MKLVDLDIGDLLASIETIVDKKAYRRINFCLDNLHKGDIVQLVTDDYEHVKPVGLVHKISRNTITLMPTDDEILEKNEWVSIPMEIRISPTDVHYIFMIKQGSGEKSN